MVPQVLLKPKSKPATLQETCTLKFKNARVVKQPLKTVWCLDQPDQGGEDDNPGRPSLPTPSGGRSLDEPPG